ncbi:Transcription factor bHLH34 [Tetrabaena socialis]|uniref:Transcription factor bHLH34 n=1 Tax=Tetrabaena socialis TaxID=47790 RepID=A0A2J8A8V8_9CHLO|nr:Transcription factor bHLH34 [Tetrabaena socialis]|eukprot:PNH08957.1 Transcription factor bHLH34 [Tetrabaena socialis]
MDPATLEAVCQVASGRRYAADAGPGLLMAPGAGLGLGKRVLDDSDSDDDEKVSGKRSKGESKGELSAAATKKACREKARREKLNERFLDLARLIDPGSEPKTDKSTILTDAIKHVQQTTVENHQLKQLNKFLEERVSTLERERGLQLYQQSLMMQGMGQAQMMQPAQAMMVGGATGMPHMAGVPMCHPQMAMHSGNMGPAGAGLLSAANSGLPSGPTPPLPSLQQQHQQQAHQQQQHQQQAHQQQHQQQVQAGMMGQAAGGMLQQALMPQLQMVSTASIGAGVGVGSAAAAAGVTFNGLGGGGGAGPSKPSVVTGMPGAMPYQGMYWLPSQMMDSTQDSLLRPPAA